MNKVQEISFSIQPKPAYPSSISREIEDRELVKMTSRPTVHDIKHLLHFMEEYPETVRGVLVHNGDRVYHLHTKVIAVPWWWLDV
jgi:hypothetical protein